MQEEKVFLGYDAAFCFTSHVGPQILVQGRAGCWGVKIKEVSTKQRAACSGTNGVCRWLVSLWRTCVRGRESEWVDAVRISSMWSSHICHGRYICFLKILILSSHEMHIWVPNRNRFAVNKKSKTRLIISAASTLLLALVRPDEKGSFSATSWTRKTV